MLHKKQQQWHLWMLVTQSHEWQQNNTYKPILLPSLSKMCHAPSSALLSWQMKTQTAEVMVLLKWQAVSTESDCCVKISWYACYLGGLGPIYNMIVQRTNRQPLLQMFSIQRTEKIQGRIYGWKNNFNVRLLYCWLLIQLHYTFECIFSQVYNYRKGK